MLLFSNGEQHFGLLPCVAILAGATAWSLGSVLNRSLDLPESRPLTSGAAMVLGGGMLLVLSASFGELHPFPHVSLRGGLALLYLVVFGSLLGFTAFVWLLARMPATRVASHAYVNPVVAVALGLLRRGRGGDNANTDWNGSGSGERRSDSAERENPYIKFQTYSISVMNP